MAHPYHMHREHQVAHRRVAPMLAGEVSGATRHATGRAFSAVTSKSAAQSHGDKIGGVKGNKRYARGGKVKHSDEAEDKKLITKMINKHEREEGEPGYARGGKVGKGKSGHQTNIAIVVPHHRPAAAVPAGLPAGPAGGLPPPPMAGPGLPPGGPGLPPGGPPPGLPPGMPMRARGGKVLSGEATAANLKNWSNRATANSYFRGGAATGVGREEKAEHMKRRRK